MGMLASYSIKLSRLVLEINFSAQHLPARVVLSIDLRMLLQYNYWTPSNVVDPIWVHIEGLFLHARLRVYWAAPYFDMICPASTRRRFKDAAGRVSCCG